MDNYKTPHFFGKHKEPFSVQLKHVVFNNYRLLMQVPAKPLQHKALYELIQQMAFIYRFHLLNLSLKVLTEENHAKEEFNHIRTVIVHHIDQHSLNTDLINKTRKSLQQLDLSELGIVKRHGDHIYADGIKGYLLNIPLYQLMDHLPRTAHYQREDWLKNHAIPLLNKIASMQKSAAKEDAKLCEDAIKLLIIIMGEQCPKCREFDIDNFTLMNSGKYADFLVDCRMLRNFYSHRAITHKYDVCLPAFLKAAHALNPSQVKHERHLDLTLFPAPRRSSAIEARPVNPRHPRH